MEQVILQCGCLLVNNTIQYCAMHKAAPALYEALNYVYHLELTRKQREPLQDWFANYVQPALANADGK